MDRNKTKIRIVAGILPLERSLAVRFRIFCRRAEKLLMNIGATVDSEKESTAREQCVGCACVWSRAV